MAVPAIVTCAGTVLLIPLSPLLIFGWGPIPALGIAGGAVALLMFYLLGSEALAAYLGSGKSVLRPGLGGMHCRWVHFRDIVRVGLVGAISSAATSPVIVVGTALVGGFVGPLYGFFGLGLVLYFASQGAGRLLWPVIANLARLLVAVGGGWLALQWGGGLTQVFIAQAVALVIYGLVNAGAIAGGARFGPVGWPRRHSLRVKRAQSS